MLGGCSQSGHRVTGIRINPMAKIGVSSTLVYVTQLQVSLKSSRSGCENKNEVLFYRHCTSVYTTSKNRNVLNCKYNRCDVYKFPSNEDILGGRKAGFWSAVFQQPRRLGGDLALPYVLNWVNLSCKHAKSSIYTLFSCWCELCRTARQNVTQLFKNNQGCLEDIFAGHGRVMKLDLECKTGTQWKILSSDAQNPTYNFYSVSRKVCRSTRQPGFSTTDTFPLLFCVLFGRTKELLSIDRTSPVHRRASLCHELPCPRCL